MVQLPVPRVFQPAFSLSTLNLFIRGTGAKAAKRLATAPKVRNSLSIQFGGKGGSV